MTDIIIRIRMLGRLVGHGKTIFIMCCEVRSDYNNENEELNLKRLQRSSWVHLITETQPGTNYI